jgi:hypothetical protein
VRRKPIFVVSCVVALAAVAITLSRRQPQDVGFDFVGKLKGQPHAFTHYDIGKGNEAQCYVFESKSAQDLISALSSELGAPSLDTGWFTAIWIKNTPQGRIRITASESGGEFYRGFRPGNLIIEGPPEVMRAIGEKYGWKKDLPSSQEIFFIHYDEDVFFTAVDNPPVTNGFAEEYTWCNTSDSDITLVIEDYQKDQYDAAEAMPMSVKVPALGKVKTKFTLPFEAAGSRGEGDCFIYHLVTADGVNHQSPQDVRPQAHDLHISVEPVSSPIKRQLVLFINADPSGRPLEVNSVDVSIAGKSVFASPGLLRSKKGRGLRIPFVYKGVRGDQKVRVDLKYRVVPNTRWRDGKLEAPQR